VEDINLDIMIERERKRLSNVIIEGKRIKLDRVGEEPNIFERRPNRILKIQADNSDDDVSVLSDTLEEQEVPATLEEEEAPVTVDEIGNEEAIRAQSHNTAVQRSSENNWTQVLMNKRPRVAITNTTITNTTIGTMQIGTNNSVNSE
jgi:hypothetical protein